MQRNTQFIYTNCSHFLSHTPKHLAGHFFLCTTHLNVALPSFERSHETCSFTSCRSASLLYGNPIKFTVRGLECSPQPTPLMFLLLTTASTSMTLLWWSFWVLKLPVNLSSRSLTNVKRVVDRYSRPPESQDLVNTVAFEVFSLEARSGS